MTHEALIEWLMAGDVSLKYLTSKYLLGMPPEALETLRTRIAEEGWGKAYLEARLPSGHWGRDFYQVKWVSSHYTLLDLRGLEIQPVPQIQETLALILRTCKSADGSVNESHSVKSGDVCVNGMFLNYASFFGVETEALKSIVDYLLDNRLSDGGWNCDWKIKGAEHSSMHTTLCVLEGLWEFEKNAYPYRQENIKDARQTGADFLLRHRLLRSEKTHEIIDPRWTMLSYPGRWRYDLLRALVYFADAGIPYDPRMEEALTILQSKRRKDGTWPLQQKHPGKVHFEMEQTGGPSRSNTLRALRVLKAYDQA